MSVVAFYDRPLASFDLDAFVFADVTLAPVGGSLGMYPPVLRMMETGALNPSLLITERVPMEAAPGMLARFRRDADARIKVMIDIGRNSP